ncbi:mRNA (2'-O-methyladenosine-N(6)-)-methyltransferase-like isoform X2 [Oscarella lobularis]
MASQSSLDASLSEKGWEIHFSKSQNRNYYFNKHTGKSVWHFEELERLEGSQSPDNDISSPAKKIKEETDESEAPETIQFVAKTKPNVTCHAMADEIIRKADPQVLEAHRLLWDIDTCSNAVIDIDACFEEQRHFRHLLPPHPDIEVQRATAAVQLRHKYAELCKSRIGIDEPRESFNRWILERKVIGCHGDPFFPALTESPVSTTMLRELSGNLPARLKEPRTILDAKRNLIAYADAAKKLVERKGGNMKQRKIIKWSTEEAFQWIRRSQSYTKEDFMDHLEHIKKQCGPLLQELMEPCVKEVCGRMCELADQEGKKIVANHRKLFQLSPDSPSSSSLIETGKNRAYKRDVYRLNSTSCAEAYREPEHSGPCYQIKLNRSLPCSLPLVSVAKSGNLVHLAYGNISHLIHQLYFDKLEMLYRIHCSEDEDLMEFDTRVWCLLTRYKCLFGIHPLEGASFQCSLPVAVFKMLQAQFDVTMELCASPFNCYFRQYCSAFADTDGYFGSRGPFFQFYPVGGSFQINPPFEEEFMEAMVDHVEALLGSSRLPLSFIIFLPDWRDPPTSALTRLESSRYKRKQLLLPRGEHYYRVGFQHEVKPEDLHFRAYCGTLIFFLQNDAGFDKWGPTEDRVAMVARICTENPKQN